MAKNVYYVEVKCTSASDREICGVKFPLNLVIAESEDEALVIMRELIYPVDATVKLPEFKGDQKCGHGKDIKYFIDDPLDPESPHTWKEIIGSYIDRYGQKYIQLWDKHGLVVMLNDYREDEPPTEVELPISNYVTIPSSKVDQFYHGVALVCDKQDTKNDEDGTTERTLDNCIIVSKSVTDVIVNPTGESLQIKYVEQTKMSPDGTVEVRKLLEGTDTWTEWVLTPVFAEEAPKDNRLYARYNAGWFELKFDDTPTVDSTNLVNSGNIKKYVDEAVTRVYRYQGSKTVAEINAIDVADLVVGDLFNIKDSGTITIGSEPCSVHAGDNIAWDGEKWDNSNGIYDLSNYVSFGEFEATLLKYTHQAMSSAYDVKGKGNLPASYTAVKGYVDTSIGGIVNPSVGAGYQMAIDSRLETNAKSVVGAINELNNKIVVILQQLTAGWNTVSLTKLFPVSWRFVAKPYCYTSDGIDVDYIIRKDSTSADTSVSAFDINVPVDCMLNCSVAADGTISGVAADYMLVSYYYMGSDGRDLDTVTHVEGSKFIGSCGFGINGSTSVKDADGNILLKWGNDNRGGGATEADKRFYEEVLIDLNAIRNADNNDIDITLYAGWYTEKLNGFINVTFNCYQGSIDMATIEGNATTKRFDVSSLGEPTYTSADEMGCYIASKISSGSSSKYETTYTPAFKIIIKNTSESVSDNHRTFTVESLS